MSGPDESPGGLQPVEETLAWEAQWRPRAGAAAILGALAGVTGTIVQLTIDGNGPKEEDGYISVVEAMRSASSGQRITEASLEARTVDHIGDNLPVLMVSSVLICLGSLGALLALTYLFRATRSRVPQLSRVVGWSIAVALGLYPVARLVREAGTWIAAANFEDASDRSAEAAREVALTGFLAAMQILEILGMFALALAFVLVSLNAMRAGLLTRFMGILGILIGALVVFQLDQPQLVRSIWLIFLGLLIVGRYPGGSPPAWETGRAEPWPTQQQLRERREALKAEHTDGPIEPEEEGELLQPGEEGYVPGAARRKRKKRR